MYKSRITPNIVSKASSIYRCWKCGKLGNKQGRCQSCINKRAEILWLKADKLLGVNK